MGTVQDIHLNGDYCAVRFDGKLQLHVIEGEGHEAGDVSEDRESIMFPESTSRNDVISCHALTPDFLIFGTDMGSLHFFFLEDWALVHEFRHNAGIKYVVPEPNGTKVSTLKIDPNLSTFRRFKWGLLIGKFENEVDGATSHFLVETCN